MKRKESWNRKSDLGEHRFFIFVLALKGVVARCERGRRKVQKPFGSHAEHGIRIHDRLRVVKKVFQKKPYTV